MKIIEFPSPLLKTISKLVDKIDHSIVTLINNMFEIMNKANGIGLAAIQVGIPLRIFIMNTTGLNPTVFINPLIFIHSKDKIIYNEGCLSFPNISAQISRSSSIIINATDINGIRHNHKLWGLEARCALHEIDHLDGITFYDYLDLKEQAIIQAKLGFISS